MHELRVLYCTRSLGSSRPTTCFQLNFDCRMREAKRRTLKFACFFVSNRPSPSGFILRRTDFLIISKTERSLCLKAFKGTTPQREQNPKLARSNTHEVCCRLGSLVIVSLNRPSARSGPRCKDRGPPFAFKVSMFMCPAVHTTTRSLLRSSSTHEPRDPLS